MTLTEDRRLDVNEHTAGPWQVMWTTGPAIDDPELIELAKERGVRLPEPIQRLTNDGERVVSALDGETRVATVDPQTQFKRGKGHEVECSERDANARLIAAAPDLLDAARVALKVCEAEGQTLAAEALRAAITKASADSEPVENGGHS